MALSAARISLDLRIPMADSIMLATARAWNATLWSQDADFAKIPGVRFVAKRGTGQGGANRGLQRTAASVDVRIRAAGRRG